MTASHGSWLLAAVAILLACLNIAAAEFSHIFQNGSIAGTGNHGLGTGSHGLGTGRRTGSLRLSTGTTATITAPPTGAASNMATYSPSSILLHASKDDSIALASNQTGSNSSMSGYPDYASDGCNTAWTTPQALVGLDCTNSGVSASLISASARQPECSVSSSAWDSKYATVPTVSFFNNAAQGRGMGMRPGMAPADPKGGLPVFSLTLSFNVPATSLVNPYFCCGSCRIYWTNVKVMYWPEPGSDDNCLSEIGPNGNAFQSWLSEEQGGENLIGRAAAPVTTAPTHRIPGDERFEWVPFPMMTKGPLYPRGGNSSYNSSLASTVVGEDGFVYTSPSIYFQVPTLAAKDLCGQVGAQHTAARLSLHPSAVSSVIPMAGMDCFAGFTVPEGVESPDGADVISNVDLIASACQYKTEAFNLTHLPCPPQTLRDWGHNSFIYNRSMSYAPVIAAFSSLIQQDPAWNTCTPMDGWDPYTSLRPYAGLAASTSDGLLASPSAEPASTIGNPPAQTGFKLSAASGLVAPTSSSSPPAPPASFQAQPKPKPTTKAASPSISQDSPGPSHAPVDPPKSSPSPQSPAGIEIRPTSSSDPPPAAPQILPTPAEPSNPSNQAVPQDSQGRPSPPAQAPGTEPATPVASTKPHVITATVIPLAEAQSLTPTGLISPGNSPDTPAPPPPQTSTIKAGQQATIKGIKVSINKSGEAVIGAGPTVPIAGEPQASATPQAGPISAPAAGQADSQTRQAAQPAPASSIPVGLQGPAGVAITPGVTIATTTPLAAHSTPTSPGENNSPGPILPGGITFQPGAATPLAGKETVQPAPQTLRAGEKATVSGEIVSIQSGGGIVVAPSPPQASETRSLPQETILAGQKATIGSLFVSVQSNGGVVIPGSSGKNAPQTIHAGQKATIAGEVVSAQNSGGVVVAPSPQQATTILPHETIQPGQEATIGSDIFSIQSGGDVVIAGIVTAPGASVPAKETLHAGQKATIAGQIVSVQISGGVIVAGMTPVTSLLQAADTAQPGQDITVASEIISIASSGGVVIAGTATGTGTAGAAAAQSTLRPGQKATIGGEVFSMQTNGDVVVATGTSTEAGTGAAVQSSCLVQFRAGGHTGGCGGVAFTKVASSGSAALTAAGTAVTPAATTGVGPSGRKATGAGVRNSVWGGGSVTLEMMVLLLMAW